MTTTDPRYAAWIRKVDAALELRCGLALDDLPDLTDLAALYEGETTPTEAVNIVLAAFDREDW